MWREVFGLQLLHKIFGCSSHVAGMLVFCNMDSMEIFRDFLEPCTRYRELQNEFKLLMAKGKIQLKLQVNTSYCILL